MNTLNYYTGVDRANLQFKLKSKFINKFEVDNVDEPVEALDLRLTKFEDDYSNVENPLIEIKQEEEPGPGDNSAADNTAAAAGDNQQDSQHHLIKVEAPCALDYTEVEQLGDADRVGQDYLRSRENYLHPDYGLRRADSDIDDRYGKYSGHYAQDDLEDLHHRAAVGRDGVRRPDNGLDGGDRTRSGIQRVVIKPSHRRKSPNPRYSPYEIRRGFNPSNAATGSDRTADHPSHRLLHISPQPQRQHFTTFSAAMAAASAAGTAITHSSEQQHRSPYSRLSPPSSSSHQYGVVQDRGYHHRLSPDPESNARRVSHDNQHPQDVQHFSLTPDGVQLMRRSPLFAQMLANSRNQLIRDTSPEPTTSSHAHSGGHMDRSSIEKYNSVGLSSYPDLDKGDEKNFDDIMETAEDISNNYDNPLLSSPLAKYTPKQERPPTPPQEDQLLLRRQPMSPMRRPIIVRDDFYSKDSDGGQHSFGHGGPSRGSDDGQSASGSSMYMGRPNSLLSMGMPRRLSTSPFDRHPHDDMLDNKPLGWERPGLSLSHHHLGGRDAREQEAKFVENKRFGHVPGYSDLNGRDHHNHHHAAARPSVLARGNIDGRLWPHQQPPPQQQQHAQHPRMSSHDLANLSEDNKGNNTFNQNYCDLNDYSNKDMTAGGHPSLSHRKFRTEDLSISHATDYHRSVIVKHNSSTDSVEKDEPGLDESSPSTSSLRQSSAAGGPHPFNDCELHGLLKLQAAAKMRIEKMLNGKSATMQAGNFLNNLSVNPYLMEQSAFPGLPFPPGSSAGPFKREPMFSSPYDRPPTSSELGLPGRRYGDLSTSPIPPGMGKQLSPLGSQYSAQLQGDDLEDDENSLNQKGKRGRPRKHAPKIPLPPLYVFIRNLLHNRAYNPSVVAWVDEETGCFKVNNTSDFAKTWGKMKANRSEEMTYEKMSRAMRYHYGSEKHGRKGHLAMVKEKRLYYRFGELAINWRREDMEVASRNPCNIHPLCRNHVCLWSKE